MSGMGTDEFVAGLIDRCIFVTAVAAGRFLGLGDPFGD
jgi:hypothetical protein